MSAFLVIALLLCLLKDGVYMATAWDDEDFFSHCPPTRCSKHGPEIRFPFRLESSNTSSLCGAPCMELACSGHDTILVQSALAAYKVTAIDYKHGTLTIVPPLNYSSCHLIAKLNSESVLYPFLYSHNYQRHQLLPLGPCYTFYRSFAALVSCLRKFTPSKSAGDAIVGRVFTPSAGDAIVGPVSCLSNTTHFSYLVAASAGISVLPLDCKVVSDGMIPIPHTTTTFREQAERILNGAEMTIYWCNYSGQYGNIPCNCTLCEDNGRLCAFSSQMNQTFCMQHGFDGYVFGDDPFEGRPRDSTNKKEPIEDVGEEEGYRFDSDAADDV